MFCKQTADIVNRIFKDGKKLYSCQTHFDFTNYGSEKLRFQDIALYFDLGHPVFQWAPLQISREKNSKEVVHMVFRILGLPMFELLYEPTFCIA